MRQIDAVIKLNKVCKIMLDRKTFTATAGAACIRITKVESLPIQAIRKIKRGIDEVEKTFQICNDLHSIILKRLIHWL